MPIGFNSPRSPSALPRPPCCRFLTTQIEFCLPVIAWYNCHMIKLTPEQTKQAENHPDGIECQGEGSDKTFVIVDAKILEKMKPKKNVKCPYSICGYADWLYSRRNSIVHGAGTSAFLKNDRQQLKKFYKREPAKTFKISVGSVQTTATFYKEVSRLLSA